ncbi:ribonuclease P [Listeria ivanovii]|uniref:ribonuclease P n=1 Tax=Listeria ivanovii TaxID=1638 RepID=UPI000DA77889|nr:ribonuclease P [Listeria ivanovii]PZF88243.1 ribonuclease P [Listeria ivanovii]PZF92894.1 ribonuclease P [Listeria ivanovii]PZG03812.1 ribonuclease P [Listeria ivanovii]PZG08203.1 ribonuclease P [Listeria ivanovii]PZG26615.1 ribonuclease P [Listeria ivanovii]
MDAAHKQIEQQLQQVKKAQTNIENHLEQTRRKQNEQDWLEEDATRFEQEKSALLELLHTGWQGEEASGFHRYLEEKQHEESQVWKKDLQAKRTELDAELQENKAQLHNLETKQATLQKEWRT